MYGIDISLKENDASFDMSESACKEREDRWFRTLTTDQQLEFLGMRFPVPDESKSLYAQAYFNGDPARGYVVEFSRFYDLATSQLQWWELNPRYMTSPQLNHATGFVLPAEVTIPGSPNAHGSTPHLPYLGPFTIPNSHICSPFPGICSGCGRYVGCPLREAEQERLLEGEEIIWGPRRPVRPSRRFIHEAREAQRATLFSSD